MSKRWQPTWEQHTWLMPHLTKYQVMPCSEEAVYLMLMHREWLENWPEEDVLWPDHPMEQHALSEDEKAELCLAEKERKEKSIQEMLKVAQATQSLTNGQRVALVKKETMALYAGKSEEIKAKVKEYIHAQKQEHGKEKAEPWSDEDQQQNLMKLATVANQFLKGLADATSLSFSLLIGGPSIELGGMIDVWSFHVGMTKLGNNFSQAYPKFESEVVGPFRDYLYHVYSEATALKDRKMGGASSSSSLWGESLYNKNRPSYRASDMMDELSKQDTSLTNMFGSLDLSNFPSLSHDPDVSKFLPLSNGPGSPILTSPASQPSSSDNILSGNNESNWLVSNGLNDLLETLAQNLPMSTVNCLMSHGPPLLPSIPAVPAAADTFYFPPPPKLFDGMPSADSLPNPPLPHKPFDGTPSADSAPSGFTHPTAHLPGNAEEPNSNRPDALPASSMAEDSTEDSRPSPIPSHTSTSANIINEPRVDEAQNDKGNDSSGPHRTRRAHIPLTCNIIANSISNNCRENVSLNPASKCSHATDSSTHAGQQAKRPRV
ncbi:uncharacterized protein BJ212DRAFT_1484671 [Suillus subaureus]|uniref:Uncharacterized protein n=1 Tax=Suillus subaureus TaxID=48587 RepID=A0A9P7J964_9AGAM|nr:uncharacterized protein BJ212DRAFT_1484671 [Suillus subaureus]KAG1809163.1 hypothetical protein BJ212DRAFT_1484671 [Suillus subaureus]